MSSTRPKGGQTALNEAWRFMHFALRAVIAEPDRILANVRVDRQAGRLADLQFSQRPRRDLHLVTDAVHIDNRVALADGVHDALQLADHRALSLATRAASARDARWLAWQMAIASAVIAECFFVGN